MAAAAGSQGEDWTDCRRRDDQCDFGKWLHSGCGASVKSDPHHSRIEQLHASFHRAARQVLTLALNGRQAEARTRMCADYLRISSELVVALGRWRKG